jgi:(S)-2-hydroxy-acid oxidase
MTALQTLKKSIKTVVNWHLKLTKFVITASSRMGTCMALSCWSTNSLEDVASSCNGLKWFVLDPITNRDVMANIIKRAEATGYKAIVLTVDIPVVGKRYDGFGSKIAASQFLNVKEAFERENVANVTPDTANRIHSSLATWDVTIPWIKSVTSLPVVLKGILVVDDAKLAVKYGADGIIVSNHGGRQLDGAPATVDTFLYSYLSIAFIILSQNVLIF